MRPTLLLAMLIASAAVFAVPALGKEGVRAKLDGPVDLRAEPGERITVLWHLVDGEGHRFGASGIYLRVSRCGRAPVIVRAGRRAGGGYVARMRVPEGKIRKLLVGLKGQRTVGHRRARADKFFQFDPPLSRPCE